MRRCFGKFAEATRPSHGCAPDDYWGLHAWSITERGAFWSAVWDFCEVIGDKGERLVADGELMPGARFLPDATLNFAENLLRLDGSTDAIVFRDEGQVRRRWSWRWAWAPRPQRNGRWSAPVGARPTST